MSIIPETTDPMLQKALEAKLRQHEASTGSLGILAPLALRLGLALHTARPMLHDPQLLVCAADHGLAVDGIHVRAGGQTDERVRQLLQGQTPLSSLAQQLGLSMTVIDCGVSSRLPAHDRLLQRKIAHSTRNPRIGQAMTLEQAHAAIRVGMEIGYSLPGNVVACAGLGVGGHESAALVLSRLCDLRLRDLLTSGPQMNPELLTHLLGMLQAVHQRHREVRDPVEVLAAFGGFEVGVMAGVMLVAATQRQVVLVDGMAACAALVVASRIAPTVTDYAVFCRSTPHQGLDAAYKAFEAGALLEMGLDTLDGTGACLGWPMLRAAAAVLEDTGTAADGLSTQRRTAAPRLGASSVPGLDVLEGGLDEDPLPDLPRRF